MKTEINNSDMEQEIKSLEAIVARQAAQIAEMRTLINYYEEQFKLSQRRRFGASSEHTPNQLRFENMFNEAEDQTNPTMPEPTFEEIRYIRKKSVGKRSEDLSGLPIERIEYELPETERICPECGELMGDIGATVRSELEIIPAKVIHKQHAVHAYACKNCEENDVHTPIIRATATEPLISGSLASPSVVAHIASQKFVNGIPIYRQEKGFNYDGVVLSRQTMANWLVYCALNYLISMYLLLKEYLLNESVLNADETTVQVLREAGREAKTKSYEWLYRTSGCSPHPVVIYEYQETRKQEHPQAFLKGFKGYLHCDGYQVYHNLPPDITIVGCWSHSRRYWEKAYETLPEDQRNGSNAERGLVYINLLFLLEDEYSNLPPQERYEQRLKYSKPASDEFFDWVGTVNALPKSQLGEAVHYALSQRKYLENVYLDGRLEFSNNRAERSLRPFVQGRKQWLFSCTPNGAESSSIYYSLIETAKENNLNPYQYIKYLLEKLPSATSKDLEALLPWSESLPVHCRVPVKETNVKPKSPKIFKNKGLLQQALNRLRDRFLSKDST